MLMEVCSARVTSLILLLLAHAVLMNTIIKIYRTGTHLIKKVIPGPGLL